LPSPPKYAIRYDMANKTYSTAEAARIIGINRVTLQRWLIAGSVREPKKMSAGGVQVRIWTGRDVERVRKYKQENYRKGRGRKPRR
jgi:predicted site-specific integrase-resolvase